MARKAPTGKAATGNAAADPVRVRLEEEYGKGVTWKKWGPYLSERQWGTVREDYSDSGSAWDYFTHDHARSRAYRWGEDGIAGVSDEKQRLCFALALWNGIDPILKERMFGLSNSEGNHGEDVKEYYFYLDSTPTHSYMKYLYKYPHRAFPYEDLVRTNRARSRHEPEYELLDTGIFDDDRYSDVFVEYAKGSPEEILIRVTAWNRGPEAATLHVLPTLWYRNIWAEWSEGAQKPSLAAVDLPGPSSAMEAEHPYVFRVHGEEFKVSYLPGDSDSGMFGGNSNWRGPIWVPVNALIVRALLHYYTFLGNDFTVGCPAGSGRQMNLFEVAREIGRRLTSLFLRDPSGRRPVYGGSRKFQEDPHWRTSSCSTNISTGTTGPGSAPATRRDGPGWSPSRSRCFRTPPGSGSSRPGRGERWPTGRGRRKADATR